MEEDVFISRTLFVFEHLKGVAFQVSIYQRECFFMSTLASTVNQPTERASSASRVRTMVSLAMLTAIAYVVMYFSKLLPQVMNILQFDLKDTVICIGGFIFGPLAAAAVAIVVALIEMFTASDTFFIGFIMNALATCSFCCTASFIYMKKHTMAGAVIGLACGTVVLAAVMTLWNWLITPLYMVEVTREQIAGMLIPVFLPFNLIKGGMNMAVTLLLYKPVVGALRSAHLIAPSASGQKGKLNVGLLLFALALLVTFVVLMLVLAGII